ncbi:hypothetical protein C7120_13065 [Prevotella sp. oral taxon 376]|nr:hypothetical protein C7120_13065 [Prevotella sp. oral taxon 376]
MASIRKVRKAFKRKNGIKEFSVRFKFKNGVTRFTPTMRKNLRRNVTELFRTNFAAWNVHR